MSNVTFQVIDTSCESADQSFFPPRITMLTKSTTQIATVIGFPEYAGFESSPPKRYKTLTWDGSSEHKLYGPTTPSYVQTNITDPHFSGKQWVVLGNGYHFGDSAITFDVLSNSWFIALGAGITFATGAEYQINPPHTTGPSGTYLLINSIVGAPASIVVTGPFPPIVTPQIAGAKFDYSGSSSIDSKGNYTSLYSKNLSSMCSATGNLVTTFLQAIPSPFLSGALQSYVFTGWLGPLGHQKCTPPGVPYSFVNNQAIGKGDAAIYDQSRLWGSKIAGPFSNAAISDFNPISSTQGLCLDSGGDPGIPAMIGLYEPLPQGVTPTITNETQNIVWFFAGVTWDSDYNSELTDEYTDSEALSNAQVFVGTGSTAQNFPRTKGFVSSFTNVVFTLFMSNLVDGQTYVASVDFADITSGTIATRQYGVIAVGTTATLTDIIPTPPPQHSIVVRNPKIVFSP